MPEFPTRPEQILRRDDPAFADTEWHKALERGNGDEARDAFIQAIRSGPRRTCSEYDIPRLYREWMDSPGIGYQGGHHLDPDMVVEQRYIGVYGIEHQFHGEIDWLFDPTRHWGEHHTREWQVQLNRHYQWVPLADRYRETGDARYAHAFENELRSWIRQCPRPAHDGMGLPGCWRLIEVGIRAAWTWPYAFETFRQSEHVSDEAIWLMVTALHEHAMHLLLWPTRRNFKAMEANGLTHVGAMFPELARAYTFLTTGLDRAIAELERQVYPDGLQDELAPSYGIVTLSNLYSAIRAAEPREAFGSEIPRRAQQRFADMAEALGRIADPEGNLPPIHDSPPQSVAGLLAHFRAHVDAERFAAVPWPRTGIACLPWGGWTVMRRPQRYSLFDAGPWGTGHQHADALQLLTYAHGRWLCIDPGKPLYNRSAVTQYLRSAEGHNVVLIDDRRHRPEPQARTAAEPWPIAVHPGGADAPPPGPPLTDKGESGSESGEAPVYVAAAKRCAVTLEDDQPETRFWHERVVLDVAGLGWLVYDQLESEDEAAHGWQWLWHMTVDHIELPEDGAAPSAHATYTGGPGLLIRPLAGLDANEPATDRLTMSVARGQMEPQVRGWSAVGPGDTPTPAATLAIHHPPTCGAAALLTLMVPAADDALPRVEITHASVRPGDAQLTLESSVEPHAAPQRMAVSFIGDGEIEQIRFTGPADTTPRHIALAPHTLRDAATHRAVTPR